MSYKEAPLELDQEFRRLVAALALAPDDQALQSSAAALAHNIRGRCIDLATWKADLSPEYKQRETQVAELTCLAGEQADAILRHDLGLQTPHQEAQANGL